MLHERFSFNHGLLFKILAMIQGTFPPVPLVKVCLEIGIAWCLGLLA